MTEKHAIDAVTQSDTIVFNAIILKDDVYSLVQNIKVNGGLIAENISEIEEITGSDADMVDGHHAADFVLNDDLETNVKAIVNLSYIKEIISDGDEVSY